MKILFVCLGNICRSPAAEVCMAQFIRDLKLPIEVGSCALGSWNVGKPAHPPMRDAAERLGFDLKSHCARMISPQDFFEFNVLIAMDHDIIQKLMEIKPQNSHALISPYLGTAADNMTEIPDPYYSGDFTGVMQQIVEGRADLVERLMSLVADGDRV